jgi:hypothetical protein
MLIDHVAYAPAHAPGRACNNDFCHTILLISINN